MLENYGTIWVCNDCFLHHANGECESCHDDNGHDCEPLSKIEPPFTVVRMAWNEHCEDCAVVTDGDYCDMECETNTYSTSQCEGCGSYLYGERNAMTLFKDTQA